MTIAGTILGGLGLVLLMAVLGAMAQLRQALDRHTTALTAHAAILAAGASADAILGRSVVSLTETLKGPLQVEMASQALAQMPAKGTH